MIADARHDLFAPPPEIPLESVLITHEIGKRAARPIDPGVDGQALLTLAQQLANSPDTILQRLVDSIIDVLHAGSAGVSLISEESGDFYWPAIAGAWSSHVGGGTPREFGPCAVVLERDAAQLFRRPERYYRYLESASPRIEEVLLAPFHVQGVAVGTVWAVSHDPRRRFDREDERVLTSLATFAAAAYQTQLKLRGVRQTELALREAKQRLEATLSGNEVATWVWEVRDDRVWADANLARLFSVSSDDAHGGPLDAYLRAIHPDERAPVSQAITRSLRGEDDRYEIDYRVTRPDGVTSWVTARGQIERDGSGAPVRFRGVLLDITERKQAEAQLVRRSEQLQALADVLPHINRACDITSVLQAGADEARRVLDAERCRVLLNAGGPWRTPLEAISAMESDEVVTYGRTNDAATPAPWTPQLIAVPLIARDGATLGTLEVASKPATAFTPDDRAVLIQIAHIVSIAAENLRLVRGLEHADRRKDEFLATLSHELRNPLAPLYTGLQLMKARESGNSEFERTRGMMERQLAHMVRLIDDLMDVSRISLGRMELRKERIEMMAVVQQAVETSRPRIEARGHRLTIELDSRTLPVCGDLARLAQVVSNLLNNAAKYTDQGGHITLALERREDHAEIRVCDSGVGIAKETMSLVFDLFTQATHSLDKAEGGLGIGLSLSRSLVELHGGSISVASKGLGQGSTFTVRLPLTSEAMDAPVAEGKPVESRRPQRVLVVDDNEDAAETLAAILSTQGHEVHVVHDGLAAVEAAERLRPQVILLDLGLPKLDGYEAGRKIREQLVEPRPMLIALTGWGLEEARRRTTAAGFDAHLVKPIDFGVLTKLLGR